MRDIPEKLYVGIVVLADPEIRISEKSGQCFLHYLRECELDAALAETRADLAAGRFTTESVDEHLA